jgi:hypothetical protein
MKSNPAITLKNNLLASDFLNQEGGAKMVQHSDYRRFIKVEPEAIYAVESKAREYHRLFIVNPCWGMN